MNLAHERIAELSGQLRLTTIAESLPHLAQKAAASDTSLTEFLESVLRAEVAARLSRQRSTLTKLAGFPAIKTLEVQIRRCNRRAESPGAGAGDPCLH